MTVTWKLTVGPTRDALHVQRGSAGTAATAATALLTAARHRAIAAAPRTRLLLCLDDHAVATVVTGDGHDPEEAAAVASLLDEVATALGADRIGHRHGLGRSGGPVR
ncbi:ATP-dependent protease ClpP protease subunit [Nocardia transvalensis]|uniref:ATP-dependent protease ClpP protease subunit n=1 Tax=Nocardia transvalensis TaxID=37333 RepID=A0A7W9PIS4_9NOCA|nr:hypothetical protein [Nocardia transvalensis]MBB5916865.1 ATP-dependent protease ClpP protease subunit [Nocardia transvalensis]